MEVCRRSSWLLLLLGVSLLATTLQGVQGEAESEGPSESECRPYIEKALKELETGEAGPIGTPETGDSKEDKEDVPTVEVTTDDSDHQEGEGDDDTHEEGTESIESVEADQNVPDEQQSEQEETQEESAEGTEHDAEDTEETGGSQEQETVTSDEGDAAGEATETEQEQDEPAESVEGDTGEETEDKSKEDTDDTKEEADDTKEEADETKEEPDDDTKEETDDTHEETDDTGESVEAEAQEEADETKEQEAEAEEAESEQKESVERETESAEQQAESAEQQAESAEQQAESAEQQAESTEQQAESTEQQAESTEGQASQEEQEETETPGDKSEEQDDTKEEQDETTEDQQDDTGEDTKSEATEDDKSEATEDDKSGATEDDKSGATEDDKSGATEDDKSEATEDDKSDTKGDTAEEEGGSAEAETPGGADEASTEKDEGTAEDTQQEETEEDQAAEGSKGESAESAAEGEEPVEEGDIEATSVEESESVPEEELSLDFEIPSVLRDRNHVEHLLKIDEEASETEKIINRVAEITLRELKKLYENAIKPLEVLYKYRDLSNRHFGDAEIFSKPLILFMGPWSGGKSSIINYLLDNEYNETSLRTGAEPSPAYFNILMHGEETEIWDGTQLAADFTFSGLQKFGQGLEERLRGVRLPSKLLEKVNIVEIPGILEVRKQVSRVFPFNDACQWFIDRADIIFLVYDPSKLDVGPETEAILDQLKGREHQTRIILNKADQVKPEELMRVQGALIWNISPLMSSAQPPIMYTTSLWSRPYESWAPTRLLQAQERAFLRDLRSAIDKRIENKIASARRFAVRVRNHAKMVDCYLTTYYNHKSVFGNRKQVADEIIEHPQDYHIYEGLSTLTNISRYDLPDPDVYKDFFKLNALYDFQQLSATCTYFRGCPINRLDVAIAYDLPELVGKHKRLVESALAEANQTPVPGS